MICLNSSMDIKPPFRLPIAPTAQLGQARQQEFRMSMLKLTPFNFIPAHPVISLFKPMCLFLSFQPQGVGSFLESLLCALICLYSVLWTPPRQTVFDYVLASLFLAVETEQAKDGLYGNVGVRLNCARHATANQDALASDFVNKLLLSHSTLSSDTEPGTITCSPLGRRRRCFQTPESFSLRT